MGTAKHMHVVSYFTILCRHTQFMLSYKDKLHRIFFGHPPQFLLDIPSEELTTRALALQGVEYKNGDKIPAALITINYITLIQDIFELTKEYQKEYPNVTLEERMHASGVLMRSEYLELIHDPKRDNWEKVYISVFYRSILVAFVRVYNMEIIDDQLSFVKEICRCEDAYTKLIEREVEQFKRYQEEATKNEPLAVFELSGLWKYGVDKLGILSVDLHDEEFTETPDCFKEVFNVNNQNKCNWLKDRTTLLFLLWLVIGDGSDKVTPLIIDTCCTKFLVKGKPTTRKVAQSTNIQKEIDKKESKLTGGFASLHSIVKSANFQ